MARTAPVRVDHELYKRILQECANEGLTLGQGLERLISKYDKEIEILKNENAELQHGITSLESEVDKLERRLNEKTKEISTFKAGKCSVCGKSLNWDIRLEEDIKDLNTAINARGFYHISCKQK